MGPLMDLCIPRELGLVFVADLITKTFSFKGDNFSTNFLFLFLSFLW